MTDQLGELTKRLQAVDPDSDDGRWSVELLDILRRAGCLCVDSSKRSPTEGARPREKLFMYEAVAAGSLTAALIVTQHHSAAELLVDGDRTAFVNELLDRMAADGLLLTVGISQLTTSRRGAGPAMRALRENSDLFLDGVMPWVTSARYADWIATGAVLEDGQQILACVPTDMDGVVAEEPMRFMALNASCTSQVRCNRAPLPQRNIIRGPKERALERRAPVKSLSVSFVGLGLAGALWTRIQAQASRVSNAELVPVEKIRAHYVSLRDELHTAAGSVQDGQETSDAVTMRARVNDLLTRLATTHLAMAKGTGYRSGDRAQQLLREAAFFLIWSAPPSVQAETIGNIWGAPPGGNA